MSEKIKPPTAPANIIIKNSSIFALIILAPFILMLVYSIKMKHEKESRKKQISKQTDKRKERDSI